jgi:RNA polymerase sigma factor (sigma-70 family)
VPTGDTTADVAVRRAALASALKQLSQEERELVALRFEGGLSGAETGAVLGISETNVGTRLSRAMAKLREAMG